MPSSLQILGLGTALPAESISQSLAPELIELFHTGDDRQRRLLPILYRRSRVERRHSVLLESSEGPLKDRISFYPPHQSDDGVGDGLELDPSPLAVETIDFGPRTSERMAEYERHAHQLAHRSTSVALSEANVDPAEITHLVTVSCTGFVAPGVDVRLIDSLGLSRGVRRTNVGFMGCHGAMNGLRTAEGFLRSDPTARVLVSATELCSLHYQYTDEAEQVIANALFADGSGSVVCGATESNENTNSEDPWRLVDAPSYLIPESHDFMSWRVGDHGFRMTLCPQLPELVVTHLPDWLDGWLAEHDLSRDQIASWAIHPGGPRILAACEEALGLTADDLAVSYDVLRECGNMSSPTILFLMERLRKRKAPRPCVALGFGPGITIEAELWR